MTKVKKIDAARRQLETAIKIYFEEGDYLSAYGLVSSSIEVTDDLYKHQKNEIVARQLLRSGGDPSGIIFPHRDQLKFAIKEEHYKEGLSFFRRVQNFLKHADKDPEAEIDDVDDDYLSAYIAMAIHNYAIIADSITHPMKMFNIWMNVVNPKLFHPSEKPEQLESVYACIKNQTENMGRAKAKAGMLASIMQNDTKIYAQLPLLQLAIDVANSGRRI